MRVLFAAAMLVAATPLLADETTGEILAFDRVEKIIVLKDKTVWSVAAVAELPENLMAGEKIHMEYKSSGEDGISSIDAIHRVAN